MRLAPRWTCMLTASIVFMTACGSDGPTGGTTDVNMAFAEAQSLAGQLVLGVRDFTAVQGQSGAAGAPSQPAVPVTEVIDLEVTDACALGGRVLTVGTLTVETDADAGTMVLDAAGTRAHELCTFQAAGVGIAITGNPGLGLLSHLSLVDGARSGVQTVALAGTFLWGAIDGRVGVCSVDLQYEENTGATSVVTGTLCGIPINANP